MTEIEIIDDVVLDGKRMAFVLAEDRLGHYPGFRDFFVQRFALDAIGLSRPGYVKAPSGMVYSLVFIGRSGEPFPSGLELHALVEALEPLDEGQTEADLWSILTWIVEGVGGEWTIADLEATRALLLARRG